MSNKSLGKPLTADLVFTKTKSDSLHNIKNLNLWGNDLEDLSLIQKMPNLEVISLSVNRISSLKDFAKCQKLQQLYLRKNNISDIRQIRHLVNLPTLKVLWLHDNPCAQIENYREIVIKHLPNLMKLDNNPVSPEERTASQNIVFSIDVPNQSNFKSEKGGMENYEEKRGGRPSSNYQAPQSQSGYGRDQESYGQAYDGYQQNQSQKQQRQKQRQRQNRQRQRQRERQKQRQKEKEKDKIQRKSVPQPNKKIYEAPKQQDINRNQNILMAVLSLMRQLDQGSLQIVRREAEKMLR